MKRIVWAVLITAVSCLPVSAKKAEFASAVREIHEVNCPASRIEIDTERKFGGDRVYVLDACGAKVEIEEGLEIPGSFAELEPLSEEEMTSLAEGLYKSHARGTPASVRAKVSAWCSEESARLEGESIAACQQRLPREVVAGVVGVDCVAPRTTFQLPRLPGGAVTAIASVSRRETDSLERHLRIDYQQPNRTPTPKSLGRAVAAATAAPAAAAVTEVVTTGTAATALTGKADGTVLPVLGQPTAGGRGAECGGTGSGGGVRGAGTIFACSG